MAMNVVGLGIYPHLQSIFNKIIFKQTKKMVLDPHVPHSGPFVPLATRLLNCSVKDTAV